MLNGDLQATCSFAESAHPIRAEWFRPLSGKAGEIHIFEAANMGMYRGAFIDRTQRLASTNSL
jgi:hypothetical protein